MSLHRYMKGQLQLCTSALKCRNTAAEKLPLPSLYIPLEQKQLFSSSSALLKRKKKGRGEQIDRRVTLIRYHLNHPLLPRPLRFSRLRALRHWTIHRAWQLFKKKQHDTQELELERQFHSMREACEALRLIGEDGLAIPQTGKSIPPPGARDVPTVSVRLPKSSSELATNENQAATVQKGAREDDAGDLVEIDVRGAAQRQERVGRLYRMAMNKTGVWNFVPIEYARAQTETPSRTGWDHAWTR